MGLLPREARAVSGVAVLNGDDLLRLGEPSCGGYAAGPSRWCSRIRCRASIPSCAPASRSTEAIRAHHAVSQRVAKARALELFRRVGIADPERRLAAFPHEMSGGMRQRVMIAMALANRPALLIADEPTTALDVTVQAQILDLLAELKRETGTALIFITHSLAVVAEIADRVVVMYAGQIVEQGPVSAVFAHALHPYTTDLLTAVPEGRSRAGRHTRRRPAATRLSAGLPLRAALPSCRRGLHA